VFSGVTGNINTLPAINVISPCFIPYFTTSSKINLMHIKKLTGSGLKRKTWKRNKKLIEEKKKITKCEFAGNFMFSVIFRNTRK
jgi:hypothetical protein